MKNSTVNAIALLVDLFTPEERKGLAITLNTHEIPLEVQFSSRWYNSIPRYEGSIFEAKAALLIHANKNLIYRVIEFSKPEFQSRMNQDLDNPESFFKVKETNQNSNNRDKKLNMSQNSSKSLNRTATKTRGGSTESGQESVEVDKVWDQQDTEFLNQGLQAKKITGTLTLGEQAGNALDGAQIEITKAGEENTTFSTVKATADEIQLEEEESTLQSITTTQTRGKTFNESAQEMIFFSEQKSNKEAVSRQKEFSKANAYAKFFSANFRDPRELFFQKLDVLFVEVCP